VIGIAPARSRCASQRLSGVVQQHIRCNQQPNEQVQVLILKKRSINDTKSAEYFEASELGIFFMQSSNE